MWKGTISSSGVVQFVFHQPRLHPIPSAFRRNTFCGSIRLFHPSVGVVAIHLSTFPVHWQNSPKIGSVQPLMSRCCFDHLGEPFAIAEKPHEFSMIYVDAEGLLAARRSRACRRPELQKHWLRSAPHLVVIRYRSIGITRNRWHEGYLAAQPIFCDFPLFFSYEPSTVMGGAAAPSIPSHRTWLYWSTLPPSLPKFSYLLSGVSCLWLCPWKINSTL